MITFKQLFKREFMSGIVSILAILLMAVWTAPVSASEDKLDSKKKKEIVNQITTALNEHYVFPHVAKRMGEHLRKRLKKGAYKKITNPIELAEVITKDLRDVSHDLHLRVGYYPESPRPREDQPIDREKTSRRIGFTNAAFEKVQRLTGNIGYLKLNGFINAEYGGATAVAAMNFLGNTDALIIDLRQNGGGAPSMIQLINSYFFDEPVHLNSFYIRKGDKINQFWTSAHIQGKRMTHVDIYVLTSKRTFSAAEEFTYNLKHMKRATIVGETTGGGAHPVDFHYLDEVKFGMSIPFGRAINPVTGTNWEGKGVKPHVEVPQEQAFDTAYDLALKKLIEKANEEKKRWIEGDFNSAGYRMMGIGELEKAIKIFKKNVELFPMSDNVYDSLGDAYMKNFQKELAIKNYKKSLELNPNNLNAARMLKKLEELKF